ncbi:unnamed protein product [Linum tenue]|uniref:Uncharacterized protein n=1 Tax=Linum tenue TaxID=586396 RepID=A0AAV0MER7_9ROSI|nr:unnamed protein product [Linum tenue]
MAAANVVRCVWFEFDSSCALVLQTVFVASRMTGFNSIKELKL